MATPTPPTPPISAAGSKARLSGLPRRLVADGYLTEESALKAIDAANKKRLPLVSHLVAEKLVKGIDIAMSASQEFGVPMVSLDSVDLENAPAKAVESKLIQDHRALPLFRRGNRMFIAVSDPTNFQGLDEIKFHTGLAIEAVVVEEEKLSVAIEKVLQAQDNTMSNLMDGGLDNFDIDIAEEGGEKKDDKADMEIDEAPVVKFVNKILLDAINQKASDIHFEPYEKIYRIRYRQDGMLREVATPPVSLAPRMTARIKVMSKMNLAEKRVPQDGRIKMVLSKNRSIDFRVNSCPTLYGEKIVLRILDASNSQVPVEALGFEEKQKQIFLENINKPYGLNLVTGPTGSGKTVTLYTALILLNQEDVNISTAEDPVEVQVTGINQVNVNPAQGLRFADALRAFLRQDPDIVMVGEIRDLETAEIAVKAAQTGHLVFSTLHTNDAPQTLTRLANMGVPPFNIATAINMIIAQRLARKLCPFCKQPDDVPKLALLKEGFKEDELEGLVVYKGVGCDKCNNGYKGRLGIFQVVPVSEEMGRIIMEGGNSIQLGDQASKEGHNNLRRSGLNKVRDGLISLTELNRVTKE